MSLPPFWQRKTLAEMTREEWESLCDGCGRCCLHKLQDEDSGELHYTSIVCRYFDNASGRCRHYRERRDFVPECLVLDARLVAGLDWLPESCAYRLLREGQDLPDWHPLVSGDPESVHAAGISIRDQAISEEHVHPDDWAEHLLPGGDD
ncbi:YcgN family cysteine cluster protein [Thiohalobacter sp. IOR34]|uniref:YcgN family cysteine cluster protein n=1 Tax=Thiohalobacter sp. IOR34 TaxID=3057176 RepID=UPI0025AF34DA|nr:YcgN family cysteine cluster protein [Thiohalobacter sp. IOR34]WJW76550.1 YcgN family cysteine cluster protein [Thiohalobacter sp. IOR34]